MKKRNFLTVLIAIIIASLSAFTAEAKGDGTYVPKFEAGRTINQSDIGFLVMITDIKTKGADKGKDVMVGKEKISVGQKLTSTQASKLTAQVSEYNNSHPSKKADKNKNAATRGAACPCEVCWWEDVYGRIWYYCCGC